MLAILIVLLVAMCVFLWLLVRTVRAGHGTPIFWLAWFIGGLAVCLSLPSPPTPAGKVFVNVWGYSLLAIPVWWVVRVLRRGRTASPRPRE